jgi:hypothetical protein
MDINTYGLYRGSFVPACCGIYPWLWFVHYGQLCGVPFTCLIVAGWCGTYILCNAWVRPCYKLFKWPLLILANIPSCYLELVYFSLQINQTKLLHFILLLYFYLCSSTLPHCGLCKFGHYTIMPCTHPCFSALPVPSCLSVGSGHQLAWSTVKFTHAEVTCHPPHNCYINMVVSYRC